MFINELILQDNILLLGKSGRPFSFKSKRYFSFDIVLLRLFVVLVFVFVFSSLKGNLLSSSSSLFSSSTSSISSSFLHLFLLVKVPVLCAHLLSLQRILHFLLSFFGFRCSCNSFFFLFMSSLFIILLFISIINHTNISTIIL